jgi:hypothetical protein
VDEAVDGGGSGHGVAEDASHWLKCCRLPERAGFWRREMAIGAVFRRRAPGPSCRVSDVRHAPVTRRLPPLAPAVSEAGPPELPNPSAAQARKQSAVTAQLVWAQRSAST